MIGEDGGQGNGGNTQMDAMVVQVAAYARVCAAAAITTILTTQSDSIREVEGVLG